MKIPKRRCEEGFHSCPTLTKFQRVSKQRMTSKNKEKDNVNRISKFYNLYENEAGSDVILLVGEAECQERIPGHSWVLVSGSDYFRALLQGPLASSDTREYHFPDDNVAGFNNLVRWLYQNKCDLQSLQSSLDTLQVAIKYLCPDLAVACVNQITKQLTVKNVLRVIRSIQCYCTRYELDPKNNCLYDSPMPSAPPYEQNVDEYFDDHQKNYPDSSGTDQDPFLDPTICCQHLYNECLDIIDKNADEVLTSEYLICASESFLKLVLQRNSLKVSSEIKVFEALLRWSTAECKRQHLPLTLENRRTVLGSLIFLIRLLSISPAEVESAKPDLASLLTEEEMAFVESFVKKPVGSLTLPPPESFREYFLSMSTRRSSTSSGDSPSVLSFNSKSKRKFSLKKKFNKKDFILDLVSILALIFD